MGERVHAGRRRDERRHADGQFGIAIATFGIISGMEDHLLGVGLFAGDDARRGRPRSRCRPSSAPRRSGRCRRDRRASTSRRYPRSPTAAASAPAMKAMHLADVERRAAAEGDDAVMAARLKAATPASTFDSVGFGLTSEKIPIGIPASRTRRAMPAIRSVVGKARIGDQQRPGRCPRPAASGSSVMRPAPVMTRVG